jgi:hypothetical protein
MPPRASAGPGRTRHRAWPEDASGPAVPDRRRHPAASTRHISPKTPAPDRLSCTGPSSAARPRCPGPQCVVQPPVIRAMLCWQAAARMSMPRSAWSWAGFQATGSPAPCRLRPVRGGARIGHPVPVLRAATRVTAGSPVPAGCKDKEHGPDEPWCTVGGYLSRRLPSCAAGPVGRSPHGEFLEDPGYLGQQVTPPGRQVPGRSNNPGRLVTIGDL